VTRRGAWRHPSCAFGERVDRVLGDPNDPDRQFSYRRCAELDRQERFPAAICAQLDTLGIPRFYVPVRFGGALGSYEDLVMLTRVIARRDCTVALAHGKTFLGSACVWLAGARSQAEQLAGEVSAGAMVSLALTEVAHGSDLLAGEVSAVATGSGFRIDGEKWLINNATRGELLCVLARTSPAGGPRGFSTLLVDKRRLAAGSHRHLPAVRTHGVRGADISGISFTGAQVPPEALVGAPGAGLEVVLKTMQVTRTLCAALSLGTADHALRLAVDFAGSHRLYGRRLIDLPQADWALTMAYADLLIAEAVTLVAARSIHALPGELSVVSAAVKYWVPTAIDGMITALSRVLGARSLLTEDFADGRFQKLQRDHRIVSIFDGNTHVNLNALIDQFAGLARGYRRGSVDGAGLAAAVTLDQPPPDFDRDQLRLVSRRGCSLVQDLPDSVAELVGLAKQGSVPAALGAHGEELGRVTDRLHERLAGHRPSARDLPADSFALARSYAQVYAAAACLQLWLRNRQAAADGATGELWADGAWLEACLARLLAGHRPPVGIAGGEGVARLSRQLRTQHREGRLFSLLPCQLTGEQRGDSHAG
jgi:alkylation response protein AidB-like acyl-CoA dehydrogenase